jgi:hypothetical protein
MAKHGAVEKTTAPEDGMRREGRREKGRRGGSFTSSEWGGSLWLRAQVNGRSDLVPRVLSTNIHVHGSFCNRKRKCNF